MGISSSNLDNETCGVGCTPDCQILKMLDNLLSGKNDGFFINGKDVGELKKLLKKSDMLKHDCSADEKADINCPVSASGSVINTITEMLQNAIPVDVFDPIPSEATGEFFTAFKQMLEHQYSIIAEKISKVYDGKAPIIVICNLASRLEADIDRTLSSVRKTDYSRVVLIALHVKPKHALQQEGTKEKLYDEKYRDLRGIVDIAFTGEDGFYKCKMNDFAVRELKRLFTETKRQLKENGTFFRRRLDLL